MSRVTPCPLRAKVADFGLTMKDNIKVSEEKPAMAVLWSAPEAIGNILHILTQLILCLDFYLLSKLHFKIHYSDCREEGVQHQV